MNKLKHILTILLLSSFSIRAYGTSATGGTITNYTSGGTNYTAHIFTNSTISTSLVVSAAGNIELLMVAGGGSGGGIGSVGGGGGGGGLIYTNLYLTNGTYNITIGKGGDIGCNGSNTIFGFLIAYGGGVGCQYPTNGQDGGSGGGGGYDKEPGNGILGQGYKGGTGSLSGPKYGAGGGGGAGGVGLNGSSTLGGNGGDGREFTQFSIFNIGTNNAGWFSGGGGGSAMDLNAGAASSGGKGGGGNGGGKGGYNGQPNTGGGGGGYDNAGYNPGIGGSGVIILRYEVQNTPTWSLYQPNLIYNNNLINNQQSPQ